MKQTAHIETRDSKVVMKPVTMLAQTRAIEFTSTQELYAQQ